MRCALPPPRAGRGRGPECQSPHTRSLTPLHGPRAGPHSDSIKDTRASLGTEGEDSAKALGLGTPGQKFTFARDAPVDVRPRRRRAAAAVARSLRGRTQVSFISCSVAKDDLADIERFMREASSSA